MLFAFDFKYAGITIDAAQDSETGEIWISTPTVESVLDYSPNSTRKKVSSKSFKAFAGEGFHVAKTKAKSTKHNNANTYYLEDTFLALMYWELKQGNEQVVDLFASGFITDFKGALQAALGKQLTEDEREYTRQLVSDRLQYFKAWCDVLHDRYLKFYGVKPESGYYSRLVRYVNMRLFGVPNFGSDRTKNMTEEQQELIKEFEKSLVIRAKILPNLEPEALIEKVLATYTY